MTVAAPVAVEPEPEVIEPTVVLPLLDPRRHQAFPGGQSHTQTLRASKIAIIQKEVANYYQIGMIDLLSRRRTADIVLPRQVAMYLAKTVTFKSLPEIGRRFRGRDHTTVLFAVRKISKLISTDAVMANEIEELKLLLVGQL